MESNLPFLQTAVIMAGGQGTRLKSVTGILPKAMVNIRGTSAQNLGKSKDTILEHQIDVLSQNGIRNFILVVGNKKEYIKPNFTNEIINNSVYTNVPYDRHISIQFFEEQAPLGTGGSFCSKELQQLIGNQDFLFTYADVLFDVNIQRMFAFHRQNGANATVLVSPCTNPDDRPICVFDGKTPEIVSMIPKQGKEDGPRGGIFPNTPKNGLIILDNSFLKVLPSNPTYLDFEENILMKLIYDSSYKVCGWQTPCYIKDIGVVSRFYEGVDELARRIPEHKNPAKYEQSCVVFRESDVLDQRESGNIVLNPEMAYTISKLNEAGVITVLERDMSKVLNYPKEDTLIDTLLVRSQNPCYVNAKIDELSEIETIAEEWNIPPQRAYYVTMQGEDACCIYSTLEPNAQPQVVANPIIALTNILFEASSFQASQDASEEAPN